MNGEWTSMAEQFLNACWGVEPLKFEVWDDCSAEPRVVTCERPSVLVGNDPGADLVLTDPLVAPRQIYFQLIGGRVFSVHLSDERPTLSGGRLWQSGWVRGSDVFEVGGCRFRVKNPDHRPPGWPEPTDNPLHSDHEQTAGYCFVPLGPSAKKIRPTLCRRKLLLIGRASPSKLLIRHRSLHPVHAAVVRTNNDLWMVDLSAGGTVTVNDAFATAVPLRTGDRVRLGAVDLILQIGSLPTELKPYVPTVSIPAVSLPADREPDPNLQLMLDHMARMQQQTFEQFRELVSTMLAATPAAQSGKPESAPIPAPSSPHAPRLAPAVVSKELPPAAPALPVLLPPPQPVQGEHADVHAWIERQLGQLEQDQRGTFSRLLDRLAGR